MEDILSAVQDLRDKQEKIKADLDKKKQSLHDKIEENFNVTLAQLRRNRELELRMVAKSFAETEEDLRDSMSNTKRILDHLRSNTDASKAETEARLYVNESELKNDFTVEHSKADRKEYHDLQVSSSRNESEKGKEKMEETVDKLSRMELEQTASDIKTCAGTHVSALNENVQDESEITAHSNLNTFGLNLNKLRTVKYSVKIHGSYNIRKADDTEVCDINGICCLANGGIVLADTKNARLKLLDSNFNMVTATEHCNVIRAPFSICQLNDEKFVFSDNTVIEGYLKYMSIDQTGNMKYIKAFSTGVKNWTVVSQRNFIYVLGEQKKSRHVSVRKYHENGGAMVGGLGILGEYMCFNSTGSRLYVTRGTNKYKKSNNVTIVDCKQWFEERCTFWHPDLNVPCGVAVDDNDQVFVCGFASKNVVHFDEDGNKVGVLLEGKDCLDKPKCLGYDKTNRRLIVAGNDDVIKVLDLERL